MEGIKRCVSYGINMGHGKIQQLLKKSEFVITCLSMKGLNKRGDVRFVGDCKFVLYGLNQNNHIADGEYD